MTEAENRIAFRRALFEMADVDRIFVMNWIDRVEELFIAEELNDRKYRPEVWRRCKAKAWLAVAEVIWDYPDMVKARCRAIS